MVTRLVLDYVRQHWLEYVVALLPVSVLWAGAEEAGSVSRQIVLALTLAAATLIGPAMALARMTPREVRLLPVSRRQMWVARWLVSVVVPTLWAGACVFAGRSLALTQPRLDALGADTANLAIASVFLYLGVLMALFALTRVGRFADGRLRPGRFWSAYRIALHLGGVGGVFWGLLLTKSLPVSLDELTAGILAVMALGAVATAAGAMHRPDPGAFVDGSRLLVTTPLKASSRWRRFEDPFTGLPKLFWWTWLGLAVPLFLAFAVIAFVSALLEYGWPGGTRLGQAAAVRASRRRHADDADYDGHNSRRPGRLLGGPEPCAVRHRQAPQGAAARRARACGIPDLDGRWAG